VVEVVPSPPEIGSWEGLCLFPHNIWPFLLLKMVNFGTFWVALLICNSTACAAVIPMCNKLANFAAEENTFQRFQGRGQLLPLAFACGRPFIYMASASYVMFARDKT